MPPVNRPSKRSSALRSLEMFLWVAGLFLLGWVGFAWADGALYQLRAGAQLDAAAASAPAQTTTPHRAERAARAGPSASSPAELPGEEGAEPEETASRSTGTEPAEPAPAAPPSYPLGRLEIPRLGLSVVVAEGTTPRVLNRAVGHLRGTPLPGTYGNSALAGHRDRHFRPLEGVRPGDEIVYTSPTGSTRYRVEWTEVVRPEAVQVLDPTDYPVLTLITCHPFDYVGAAPNRFVVRARQVG